MFNDLKFIKFQLFIYIAIKFNKYYLATFYFNLSFYIIKRTYNWSILQNCFYVYLRQFYTEKSDFTFYLFSYFQNVNISYLTITIV